MSAVPPPGLPAAAPEPDDFALMAAVRAGAPGAFEALSGRWRSRLVNFLKGLGADLHGAEDCAQETLLRVYRYRDQYRPDHPFTAFLFTLARHSFLDWRRKAVRWERDVVALPADEPGAAPAREDPAGAVGDRIDLVAAVAGLPRRLRDVVELGAIRGLPYHKVAALLGLPVGTVKSRMHHAVRRLREALGDGPPP